MKIFNHYLPFFEDIVAYLIAAALFLLTISSFFRLKGNAAKSMQSNANLPGWRRKFSFFVSSLNPLTLVAMGVLAASIALPASPSIARFIRIVVLVAAIVQVAAWSVRFLLEFLDRRAAAHAVPIAASALSIVRFSIQAVIWIGALLLVLDNLGVNITTLVTGLGIGGIAVALAAQSILSDVFASLSIVFDRPFEVGDFVIVGQEMGTIEHVGIKTTRIRSLSGEQIVINNADLLQSRIKNYKRLRERRVLFTVGLTYSTPIEHIERFPSALKAIIEQQPKVRFDRAHFKEHGDSALIFEVVYFFLDPDFTLAMDTRERINIAIHRYCTENNLSFAFPSRTVYLEKS